MGIWVVLYCKIEEGMKKSVWAVWYDKDDQRSHYGTGAMAVGLGSEEKDGETRVCACCARDVWCGRVWVNMPCVCSGCAWLF